MRLNTAQCPENIQKPAEELKKQIPLDISEDSLKLIANKITERGFQLKKGLAS